MRYGFAWTFILFACVFRWRIASRPSCRVRFVHDYDLATIWNARWNPNQTEQLWTEIAQNNSVCARTPESICIISPAVTIYSYQPTIIIHFDLDFRNRSIVNENCVTYYVFIIRRSCLMIFLLRSGPNWIWPNWTNVENKKNGSAQICLMNWNRYYRFCIWLMLWAFRLNTNIWTWRTVT